MPVRMSARGSRIKTHGIEQTFRALGEMKRRDGITISEGVREAAQIVFDESQILVPKDTLSLMTTGEIEWNGLSRFAAFFRVKYGGWTPYGLYVDYAVPVHERDDLAHDPPTRDHYLSIAVQTKRAECSRAIGRRFLNQERILRRPDPKFTDRISTEDWNE